jgi:chromosome partitioning protein
MVKIVSFFNHKGGVGKTTLVSNLAWYMAHFKEKRMLLIDADSQQNLTSFVSGYQEPWNIFPNSNEDIESSLSAYDYFSPIIDRTQVRSNKTIYKKTISGKSLSLLKGDLKIAEFDYDFVGMDSDKSKAHIPLFITQYLAEIGKDFDFIFIDTSPNLGILNKVLMMCSDYIIIPAMPALFSVQAIENLRSIFIKWNGDMVKFRKSQYEPNGIVAKPKFLGLVSQNFRPRESNRDENNQEGMATAFNRWQDELKIKTVLLANELNDIQMSIRETQFKEIFNNKTPYLITDISDLNQLGRRAEEKCKPIFLFSQKELTDQGLNQGHYKQQINDLEDSLKTISDGLLKL